MQLRSSSMVVCWLPAAAIVGVEQPAWCADPTGAAGAGPTETESRGGAPAGEESDRGFPETEALGGPDTPNNRISDDQKLKKNFLDMHLLQQWDAWKRPVYDRTGLKYGIDYNALGDVATESPGDIGSAGGVVRLYGSWDLFGRGTRDASGLVYKIEHRHGYTDVAPAAFASELDYVGSVAVGFNDQGFRATHVYWQQNLFDQRLVIWAGFLDTTDYVDVYALVSPWTAFSNLAFSNGSGTIGGEPDGALGVMAGGFLTKHLYAISGFADANGDSADIGDGFDTFFTDFETFVSFELGWTSSREQLFLDNAHVTFWWVDARQQAGTPTGWGLSFSFSKVVAKSWLPFVRGGWAKDGGSLYEGSVSAGVGYQHGKGDNLLGIAVNWSLPNADTFGADLESQFAAELFYRIQLTQRLQLTPSVQLIGNPAQNPQNGFLAVFGMRARVAF